MLLQSPTNLLDLVREKLQSKNYSIRTEQTYLSWVDQFLQFNNLIIPNEVREQEVLFFLEYLAVDRQLAISTQNQALCALRFLFREVLKKDVTGLSESIQLKRHHNLPIVLTKSEIGFLFEQMKGIHKLMAQLLYGSGLCLMECLQLRVQDLDFLSRQIIVRDHFGEEIRVTILPDCLVEPLQRHLRHVHLQHEDDLADGNGFGYPPKTLSKNYPGIEKEWIWQYVFPSDRVFSGSDSHGNRRNHVDASGLQKAIHKAAIQAEFEKHVSAHTLRHTFAVHMLEAGYDILTVKELLGHKDLSTTMIYKRVLQQDGFAVRSPLDIRN